MDTPSDRCHFTRSTYVFLLYLPAGITACSAPLMSQLLLTVYVATTGWCTAVKSLTAFKATAVATCA
jgi:hypothetical protein